MKNLLTCLLAAAALLPVLAHAQLHDGDIEVSIVDSRLRVSGNDAWHANGSAVFEGDFGDLVGGPYATNDPGYDSPAGTFAVGALLNYAAVGNLQFWNGSQWLSTVPGFEYVQVLGSLGEVTRWTTAGVTGSLTGLVGQAGSNGKIHQHLNMSVARDGGGTPAVGAYLISLQLTSPGYLGSAPYYIALNRGLDDEAFEVAVTTLAAVPEAQTWLMLSAGMALLALRRRKQARLA